MLTEIVLDPIGNIKYTTSIAFACRKESRGTGISQFLYY